MNGNDPKNELSTIDEKIIATITEMKRIDGEIKAAKAKDAGRLTAKLELD